MSAVLCLERPGVRRWGREHTVLGPVFCRRRVTAGLCLHLKSALPPDVPLGGRPRVGA